MSETTTAIVEGAVIAIVLGVRTGGSVWDCGGRRDGGSGLRLQGRIQRAASGGQRQAVDAHRAGDGPRQAARRARPTPGGARALEATIEIERTKEAPPFRAETDGPGNASAQRALARVRHGARRGGVGRIHPVAAHPRGGRAERRIHPLGDRRCREEPHPFIRRERGPGRDRGTDRRTGPADRGPGRRSRVARRPSSRGPQAVDAGYPSNAAHRSRPATHLVNPRYAFSVSSLRRCGDRSSLR